MTTLVRKICIGTLFVYSVDFPNGDCSAFVYTIFIGIMSFSIGINLLRYQSRLKESAQLNEKFTLSISVVEWVVFLSFSYDHPISIHKRVVLSKNPFQFVDNTSPRSSKKLEKTVTTPGYDNLLLLLKLICLNYSHPLNPMNRLWSCAFCRTISIRIIATGKFPCINLLKSAWVQNIFVLRIVYNKYSVLLQDFRPIWVLEKKKY